jgi:hypothetical protein
MRIAVIGEGKVGGTLGRRWAQAGHQIVYGVRNPAGEKVLALLESAGHGAEATDLRSAAAQAEVVVLATPWGVTESALRAVGDLRGKIVIDCTNPLAADGGTGVPAETSGGKMVAGRAVGARVVKAFNSTGRKNMEDPRYGPDRATMFLCGDDAEAKRVVGALTEALGFEVCDAGPLSAARHLEALALLWIHLAG